MRQGARASNCRIIAVDNAPAMVKRCRQVVAADRERDPVAAAIEVVQGDIRDVAFSNASMIVLNYTLQFLPIEQRDEMLARILGGLNDKGLLVLSEKVIDPDPHMERLLVDLHHEHKRRNDYSALEISRKRAALENVLLPETVRHPHRSACYARASAAQPCGCEISTSYR